MKLAICNELFEEWSWDKICDVLPGWGYGGIELAPFTLAERPEMFTAQQRRQLRLQIEKAGLQIIGLHWLLARTTDFHLTTASAEIRRKTSERLRELAYLCRDLGGDFLVLGSPQQRNRDPQTSPQVATERAVQVVQALLPTLEDTQVTLALEPLGPEETNFWNTAAEVREFIRIVDSPQVKLHLDVKAMSTEPRSIAAILQESAGELVHFHANDPNRLGPGMGSVDYRQFWPTLQEIEYRGWISVEVFDFRPGPEVIAETSANYLRRL